MKSKRITQIVLVATIAVSSLVLVSCQRAAPVEAGIEDEEYRVMSAALKYFKYQRTYAARIPGPRFVDSLGRLDSLPVRARPEKPREFRYAPDTTKARAAHDLMLSIYGDVKYYLTVKSRTLDRDGMHVAWYGDETRLLEELTPIMRDLYIRNQKEYDLDAARFRDSLIVRLIDPDEFKSPKEMYSLLPLTDGRIWLSRPGFSPDRRQAIVFHFRKVHPVGGTSMLVQLQKNGVDWEVVDIEKIRSVTGGW